MEKERLLHYVAPCSLLCYTCTALVDGAIPECSRRLHNYFEGFGPFRSGHLPPGERAAWQAFFEQFQSTLNLMGGAACPGCRNSPGAGCGCIEGCVVPDCVRAHGVDFCAECGEFPCQSAKGFFAAISDGLAGRWETGNRRIRQIGAEAYFDEKKDISHYIDYKEERPMP